MGKTAKIVAYGTRAAGERVENGNGKENRSVYTNEASGRVVRTSGTVFVAVRVFPTAT